MSSQTVSPIKTNKNERLENVVFELDCHPPATELLLTDCTDVNTDVFTCLC